MTHLTLKLLGPFSLELAGSACAPSVGRKGEALLTLVALHGAAGAVRTQLMARLWPDLADDDARNALRQCLHQVRRASETLALALDADGERIVLREQGCDVDVHRFEQLARHDDTASLLAAAELYRGDLVERLDAGSEFALWLASERERLRELAQRLLTRLSDFADNAAARDCAADLARRLLATDPVHEGAWRALIRLQVNAGLRAKAAQTWSACRRVLWRELRVEPSAETASMVRQLLTETAPGEAAPAIATLSALPPGVFEAASDADAVLDLMLRGWQCFAHFTSQGNLLAREAFVAAIARAPGHA
jgi:DNA-binding SARP family transcriptional activator